MTFQHDERPGVRDQYSLAAWAADCAERVLPLFEVVEPVDERPRKAIEAARAWVRGDLKMTKARECAFAAHAAARNTDDDSARLAARAAGHAAATAHVVGHAQYAADYAIKAIAAVPEGNFNEKAIDAERDWQYKQLPVHLRPLLYPGTNRLSRSMKIKKDQKYMYGLISKLIAVEGKRDELAKILIDGVSDMPGCRSYVVANDSGDENGLWITEVWETEERHGASLSIPTVQETIRQGRPLIEGFGDRIETAPIGGYGI